MGARRARSLVETRGDRKDVSGGGAVGALVHSRSIIDHGLSGDTFEFTNVEELSLLRESLMSSSSFSLGKRICSDLFASVCHL